MGEHDVVLGILLVAFSGWILAAIAPPTGAGWFEILCGIWLIVAPFVLRVHRDDRRGVERRHLRNHRHRRRRRRIARDNEDAGRRVTP